MAISQFVEPDINLFFDDLTQAARLDNKASFYGKGYINILPSNIDSIDMPVLLQGSMFECGGVLFVGDSDTGITGTPSDGQNYIYFNPSTRELLYNTAIPAWNTVKGGWYNGNNRAIVKLNYTAGNYNGKIILDSYNAMQMINREQPIPASGGTPVVTGVVNSVLTAYLEPGMYRYEIAAGKGGTGGTGVSLSLATYCYGGSGAAGESNTGIFVCPSAKKIRYALGGDGLAGGNYGGDNSAGGGGCSGGSSFIDLGDDFIFCLGGSGGGGGAGGGAGGGGGGGGYGTGNNGNSISQIGQMGYGGEGGHAGIGGNGGNGASGGGGGSGNIRGGTGGTTGGGNGGGYGNPGGNGGGGSAGFSSQTGENSPNISKYLHKIQYQSGGAGGGPLGGTGAGSLISSSSGYLRIYRMW
jgi:hypothetical protein